MDNGTEKTPKMSSKSFFSNGPTLHYSHKNVQRYWLCALITYIATALFWSKILKGSFFSPEFQNITSFNFWQLGQYVISGVSIFEYPWQILVLGLLMGILSITPILISQLMSFRHSLLFIISIAFFANHPGFALSLLISCIAVACRPLRFRSRFISIALCASVQLLYWGFLGGSKAVEPIKWGFSFTPWISAGLIGLGIAGFVLGVGHYTRYKPGLVFASSIFVLLNAIVIFEITIGFDELDYQLYVAKNSPEQVIEFHDHSITELLDSQITNPSNQLKRHVASRFYPREPITLRTKLKEKIQNDLRRYDRWPGWFIVPEDLNYQAKRNWLFKQYDLFISKRFKTRRMPIALYYKAILSEYSLDINLLGQNEMLHFYSDYPFEHSQDTWYWLYTEFGDSPESLEARWRIAKDLAGQGKFEQSEKLLLEAKSMLEKEQERLQEEDAGEKDETFFRLFKPPPATAMTVFKLSELKRKINHLSSLIGTENRTSSGDSSNQLATFVMLNPHSPDYPNQIEELLLQMGSNDPLRDNVLLENAKLVADAHLRAEKFNQLHKKFPKTDGGMQSLYELGLLKICLWRELEDTSPEQKKKHLAETRSTLTSFVELYPDSIYTKQVIKNLADLPLAD